MAHAQLIVGKGFWSSSGVVSETRDFFDCEVRKNGPCTVSVASINGAGVPA